MAKERKGHFDIMIKFITIQKCSDKFITENEEKIFEHQAKFMKTIKQFENLEEDRNSAI